MATRTMLHTLSLDRCDLASLSQAMPSVKHLTLRKIGIPVSTLSLFPNIDELHIIRLDIEKCVDTSRFPNPSFKIRTLILECCSRRGGVEAVNNSISSLWIYFQSKAHEQGVQPFEHLHTLGMSFYEDPAYFITKQLIKEAPNLQNMFLAFPSYRLDILDLVRKSIYRVESLQYTYISPDDVHIPDVGFMSQAAFMRHCMSYRPSFSANNELVTHPAFIAPLIHPETQRFSLRNLAHTTLKAWAEWVTLLKDIYPNATGLEATHVLMIDQRPISDEGEGFDEVAEKIAKKAGRLWGLHFCGFNDHHAVHPMKLVITNKGLD
ncbi:hypothetical protein BJ165DRAFT_1488625 [Panaeolus papilionaceus]|nr:hypothetical protein BJ165DRAFT_1488625 [Panaeolus papilionaceus]